MNERSDEELIAAYHRGEEGVLTVLVERHLGAVGAYCQQLTLNRDKAQDITQETFVKAIRSLATFRGVASFRTWLLQIATNVVRDSWSRGRKEVPYTDDGELAHRGESPEQVAIEAELDQAIQMGLSELPLPLRTAFVLTTLQGLTSQQVADLEGCTISTIYWRVHEARKLMKRRLQSWIR